MLYLIASRIMPRTTVSLDATVLRELKRRARQAGKSLGQVISEIVAPALGAPEREKPPPSFTWREAPMGAKVDLEDKEAVRRAMGEA